MGGIGCVGSIPKALGSGEVKAVEVGIDAKDVLVGGTTPGNAIFDVGGTTGGWSPPRPPRGNLGRSGRSLLPPAIILKSLGSIPNGK